jgi:hypothetical protein
MYDAFLHKCHKFRGDGPWKRCTIELVDRISLRGEWCEECKARKQHEERYKNLWKWLEEVDDDKVEEEEVSWAKILT